MEGRKEDAGPKKKEKKKRKRKGPKVVQGSTDCLFDVRGNYAESEKTARGERIATLYHVHIAAS